MPPKDWSNAFLLTQMPRPAEDRVVANYRLGADDLYLVCRGSACASLPPRGDPSR